MANDSGGQKRATQMSACEISAGDWCRPRRRVPPPFWKIAALLCLINLPLEGLLAQVSNIGQSGSDDLVLLRGAINPRAHRENDRGPLERDRRLSHITLGIKRAPEQQAALERLLQEQQNPSSPNYHKWLTPDEFGRRFGVSQDDLDKVVAWVRAQGLTVESTARGRGWVIFSGTVRQVERAFRTEVHQYQAGDRMHFGPAIPPAIPAEFGAIVRAIRGLDDFYWEPSVRWRPMYTAANGTHSLAPGDVAAIYEFDYLHTTGTNGQGQKIVVAGQSAVELTDIQKFRSTFGLSDNVPQVLLAGDDPGIDRNGGMLEADADIEWAGAEAPDAQIIYVYATDVLDAVQTAIDQNLAPVISLSYGACEPSVASDAAAALRDLAQQANTQGITWVASSGDAGAAACDRGSYPASQGLAVSLPASLPEVTGVGGTEFNEGGQDSIYWEPYGVTLGSYQSASGYIPEIAWNGTSCSAA